MQRRKRKVRGHVLNRKTQVRQNQSGRMWAHHALNLDFDKKFYLPFMNILRNEGYYVPYWLDLHPKRECIDITQSKYLSQNINENTRTHNNENENENANESDKNLLVSLVQNDSKYGSKVYPEWNNEEGFNDPFIFELKEQSKPYGKRRARFEEPGMPPVVRRMFPPEPDENDLKEIEQLKKSMDNDRLWKVGEKFNIRAMLR